ncbi:MAG: RluA family pseudouridine synthase [Roseburia sp.]|nr:RluA family pseudouridine synthase [Roseburia sp.]MCM1098137.1 RluA family pseudouridine synthase [Ruminococcus flavefaciens]
MKTEIVYEDRDLLVIWKPAGLATQTAKIGQADVVSELKKYLATAGSRESSPYLGVVHRLDQPVEGLLVFAKNRKTAAALTRQLGGEEGALNKQYYAVICGKPSQPEGRLVDFLRKGADGRAEAATRGENIPNGYRRAALRYKLLQTVEAFPGQEISLVEIELETGRFHQIRAQMANAGTPLLGDMKYGSEASRSCGGRLGIREAALCAWRIVLTHPATGKDLCFERRPTGRAFTYFEGRC